jgi:hypothetical protein
MNRWSFVLSLCFLLLFNAENANAVCKAPSLKQGLDYDKAREIVIDAGFQAPLRPVHGYAENDEKVISECYGQVDICNRYPEIVSCSGNGHCRMEFTDAYGNKLFVFTYGAIGTSGDNMVSGFQIECKNRRRTRARK